LEFVDVAPRRAAGGAGRLPQQARI